MTPLKMLAAAAIAALFAMPATAEPPQTNQGEVLSEPLKIETVPKIVAQVNGLVCDFCAQALKKIFKKETAVDYITVDLNGGVVEITLKPGQQISDERVADLIRKSGYSLVTTTREGGA